MPEDPRELVARLRPRLIGGMAAANVVGGVVVYVFMRWILPLPTVPDPDAASRENLIAFALYLLLSVPAGIAWSFKLHLPVQRWLESGCPPDERAQRDALRAPIRQLRVHALLWGLAGVLFVALNVGPSPRLALDIAVTVVLGATTTGAVGYLLAERILRPVTRAALAARLPERPVVPGVSSRILIFWALGTGVPVLGLAVAALSLLTGLLDASSDRLAAIVLFLGGIALVVGLLATVLSARSLADPLEQLRRAMGDVQRGRTDVGLEIYDGGEIGLLQAGFNHMIAAVREREELQDLFGRQVGEEVARQALERGITLGGETREVGVLFVDLVGSTELAATRPPDEVVELLNEFFCVVVAVVSDHGGAVNKFEGDAALCVFGAPLETPDAAGSALAAARELRRRLAEEVPGTDLGIGVSAGEAVAGNIGSAERFEYTVIGDPVNEASRLTELAKRHPARALASAAALQRAGEDERRCWELGEEVELRGRGEPTRVAAPSAEASVGGSRHG
ncbi:MAG TPA: adenylate/guanylate cyclase domain-containing protein [Solirubrobacteraceae bacterium]|jgi:adenylate cyclase|nr:adenylate/guanylate cyclase domain-containing protein [Solirubrobacteraceae bacterium]